MPFDPSTATPIAGAFDPSTAKSAPTAPTLVDRAMKDVRAVGPETAKAFGEGAATAEAGMRRLFPPRGLKGELPEQPGLLSSAIGAAQVLAGGMQEAAAPLTGAVRAFLQNPTEEAGRAAGLPEPVAKGLGYLIGDAGQMFGPMAVGKTAEAAGQFLPQLHESVKKLMDAGIRLTPGQIWSGMTAKLENTVESLPIAGSFIKAAQMRSIDDFNRAVINKSLSQIGTELPKGLSAGRKAIAFADDAIGAKYDSLLPKLTFKADPQFAADIAAIEQRNSRWLDAGQQKQWAAVKADIADHLVDGTMPGTAFKRVESELSHLTRAYLKAADKDPAAGNFAIAVQDANSAFRAALERSNPAHANELQNLNGAWASFARAQDASIRNVKSGGVFSPADLLRSIKASTTKGIFARGDAHLQPLADAAAEVLPATIPELGMYERGLWLGLLGAGEAGYLGHIASPGVIGTAGTLSAAYTKPGIAALNAAVKSGPRVAAQTMREMQSPLAGVAATIGAQEDGR